MFGGAKSTPGVEDANLRTTAKWTDVAAKAVAALKAEDGSEADEGGPADPLASADEGVGRDPEEDSTAALETNA